MPKLRLPKEAAIEDKSDSGARVKQKRKNAHQVRKYFQAAGPNKQRCTFCGWETRENATRMVQHIVQRCNDASPTARDEISASVIDAEERQLQSFYTSHNKKVVHDFFKSVDNDRKRECVFCKWTTILNLTRMRFHILEMCHYVPPEIRQSFLKQENSDDPQYDTYCIVNVDDGDRKGLQVVSSSSFEHPDSAVVQEVVINSVDYIDQLDYEDESAERMSEDQPDDLPTAKPASDEEIVLDLEEDVNESEEDLEEEGKKAEIQYVGIKEGYYNRMVSKCKVRERSSPVTNTTVPKQLVTEARGNQMVKPSAKLTTVRVVPQNDKPRLSEEQLKKFRTRLAVANTPKQTIVVKKEQDTKQSPPKSAPSVPQKEKQDENPTPMVAKSVNNVKTSQQAKHRVATSTPLHNTPPRQVRAVSFIKQTC